MTRDIIRTPNAPSSPTYSQAVRAAGLVFVSGTGPHHPVTGKIVGDTIQEQTRQCLENCLPSSKPRALPSNES
jgi:2-iminobutanoate/2-iminopropanoate deaminase